jgi:trimeric autotransporter adhesin
MPVKENSVRRTQAPTVSALAAAALSSVAAAQPCDQGWHYFPQQPSHVVVALAPFDEPNRRPLFVGGAFLRAGSVLTGPIARWDGAAWSVVGPAPLDGILEVLKVLDIGEGARLFAAGSLTLAGTSGVGVASWDGQQWTPQNQGLVGGAYTIAVHDDGTGPALYAGGLFWLAEHGPGPGMPRNLARWTGTHWTSFGGGASSRVTDMMSYDDGTGPALFVTGWFTSVGGNPHGQLARWKDGEWLSGHGNNISATGWFVRFDAGLGGGERLYLVGSINSSGVTVINGLFRWQDEDWEIIGDTGPTPPETGHVWDDGRGATLYIGGGFRRVNGASISHVAKWDGVEWSGLGAGFLSGAGNSGYVAALQGFEDDCGRRLIAGGSFNYDGTPGSHRYLAAYNPPPPPGCYANCDGSTVAPVLNVGDFMCFINEFAGGMSLPHNQQVEHYANCDGSMVAPALNVDDFTCFINAFATGCP